MKRKLSFLFLSALTIPFFMGSCSDDKEEQEVKPATDLVVDNNSVTLLQGDEITVSITSGNGDYYVKPFDENVATATINGNKVTIKATENSQLEENNRTETTILIVVGLESVFLLRAEAKDVNPRFEIATKINGKSDPRFRSQQTIYCDDSEGGRKTPGKWYHIAIVYDGTKSSTKEAYKMYINGVRETLTPADNSYEDCAPNSSLNLTDVGGNDKALLIGRSGDSYRVGYCKVYQARMWKRALDESEIKANMCKILNAEEHSDLMGYWVFSKGVGGTTVFENWGNGGSGLDAQVCLQNISENKPAWGAELPATYNGDKSRFEPIECPHSY